MTLPQCHGCDLFNHETDSCSTKYDEMKTCIDGLQYRPKGRSNFKGCPECKCIHGKYPSISIVLSLLDFHKAPCRMAAHNWVRWALRNTAKRCNQCHLEPERKYPLGKCNPFADCYGPMREGLCIVCNEIKILNTDGVCENCWVNNNDPDID
jgi:hypothetical protein